MAKLEKIPRYTTIIHGVRLALEISTNEYCVADIVYALSNNPDSKVKGWCYASKKTIGEFMGIHERRIRDIIDRLVIKKLVEKDAETKYLRTTSLWYQSVVLERLKMKNTQADETSARRTKRQKQADETSVREADETSDNKNKQYKHNNTSLAPKDGAGKKINVLIDLFKNVNPSFDRLFSNKTERKALERMVKKHGEEKIKFVIEKLPITNKIQFAPTITTPYQLEKKLGSLIVFYQRKKAEKESDKITIATL